MTADQILKLNKKRKFDELHDPVVAEQLNQEQHPSARLAISSIPPLPIEIAVPEDVKHLLDHSLIKKSTNHPNIDWPELREVERLSTSINLAVIHQYVHHLAVNSEPIPLDLLRGHREHRGNLAYSTDHDDSPSSLQGPLYKPTLYELRRISTLRVIERWSQHTSNGSNTDKVQSRGIKDLPPPPSQSLIFQQLTSSRPLLYGLQHRPAKPSPLALAHLAPVSMPGHGSKKAMAAKRRSHPSLRNLLAEPHATINNSTACGHQTNAINATPTLSTASAEAQLHAPSSSSHTALAPAHVLPVGMTSGNQAHSTNLQGTTTSAPAQPNPPSTTAPVPGTTTPLDQPLPWYDHRFLAITFPLPTHNPLVTTDPRVACNRNTISNLPANLNAVFPLPEPSLNRYQLPSPVGTKLPELRIERSEFD